MSWHRVELLPTQPRSLPETPGDLLELDPTISTVVPPQAHRMLRAAERGEEPDPANWWLTFRDGIGRDVGAGRLQPPSERRVVSLLPVPIGAVDVLAAHLVDRGQHLDGINSARPSVSRFGEEWRRHPRVEVSVTMLSRPFELGELITPRPAPGELRAPYEQEFDLVARLAG